MRKRTRLNTLGLLVPAGTKPASRPMRNRLAGAAAPGVAPWPVVGRVASARK